MSMIYEAVKVDEELGGEEAWVKEATYNAPSPYETHSKIMPLCRGLIVILNTIALGCFLLIDLHHINLNSNSAEYFVYGAVVPLFIELFFMKLYVSLGGLLLYFIFLMVDNISDISMSVAMVPPLSVLVFYCNFLVVYFLALDEQFNERERCKMEIIFIMIMTVFLSMHFLS